MTTAMQVLTEIMRPKIEREKRERKEKYDAKWNHVKESILDAFRNQATFTLEQAITLAKLLHKTFGWSYRHLKSVWSPPEFTLLAKDEGFTIILKPGTLYSGDTQPRLTINFEPGKENSFEFDTHTFDWVDMLLMNPPPAETKPKLAEFLRPKSHTRIQERDQKILLARWISETLSENKHFHIHKGGLKVSIQHLPNLDIFFSLGTKGIKLTVSFNPNELPRLHHAAEEQLLLFHVRPLEALANTVDELLALIKANTSAKTQTIKHTSQGFTAHCGFDKQELQQLLLAIATFTDR